jgi:hypothetical protein
MTSDEGIDLSVPCAHVAEVTVRQVHRPPAGCEECLKIGSDREKPRATSTGQATSATLA